MHSRIKEMKMIRLTQLFLLMSSTALITLIMAFDCMADTAEVLPKGVTRIRLESKFSIPTEEQFNNDGDVEEIGADYSRSIDSTIFSQLSLLEAAFGMASGSATLGTSVVDVKYRHTIFDLYVEHGLTEKLSVGAKIPYWFVNSDVNARMDTSTATLGFNPYYGQSGDPFGTALIPVSYGGVLDDDMATELVQDALVDTYGYNRLDSWSGRGLSDIEIGARYQYWKTDSWRLAVLGGIRLPTGETDDPDNLIDYPMGTGAYGIFIHQNTDYTGINNLLLNLTLKYNYFFPDSETVRVPDDISQPLTSNKEEVDRRQGNGFEINATAIYEITKSFGSFLYYEYQHQFKDSISGDMGYAYDQLENESETRSHIYKVGFLYSTLALYKQKKFPLPMEFHLLYRDRFAGKNIINSRYIQFGAGLYF